MGLYLLNLSVDPVDTTPHYIPEDLSVNDQESVIELIVEQLFGFENAFQEFDDHDTHEHSKKAPIKIDLMTPYKVDSEPKVFITLKKKLQFPDLSAAVLTGFQKLDSPPPNI